MPRVVAKGKRAESIGIYRQRYIACAVCTVVDVDITHHVKYREDVHAEDI